MQRFQLNIRSILWRVQSYFPENEVVSRQPDGSLFRYTYREFGSRVHRLAAALKELGVKRGERISTFAWNHFRHLELYFAIPCYGAVLHTVNIRLSGDDIAYILNHAESSYVFLDPDLIPVIESLAPNLQTVKGYIVLDHRVPETRLEPVFSYEDLIKSGDSNFEFEELDEDAPAGMCYTSATTGKPKGVVYTQRSMYLHALMLGLVDTMGICEQDNLLPVVPMFHVNSWGIPFSGVWMGSKMVLPGPRPRAEELLQLIESERVTFAAAAVTVGIDMLNVLRQKQYDISSLRALMLGGQATPKAVMEEYLYRYGVPVFTAWGATETSPIATNVHLKRHQQSLSDDEKLNIRVRQGIPVPGIELQVVGEDGRPVPWDDRAMGEIRVRGPWVASSYYRDERSTDAFVDGWWKSGDIATVDSEGVIRLVDRAKDLIKSGGEWISSVSLENELMAHPAVREAAVVAAPHEKWLERPVAFVALEERALQEKESERIKEELADWLQQKYPKWWLPDEFVFVQEIPRTGAGKFNKRLLRERAAEVLRKNA